MSHQETELFREAYPQYWEAAFTDHCNFGSTEEIERVHAGFEEVNLVAGPADEILGAVKTAAHASVSELVSGIEVKTPIIEAIAHTWNASCADKVASTARIKQALVEMGYTDSLINQCFKHAYVTSPTKVFDKGEADE